MKCPDCGDEMEKEDASVDVSIGDNFKRADGSWAKAPIVAARYFSPGCGEYFHWTKGERLMRQNAGIHQRSSEL